VIDLANLGESSHEMVGRQRERHNLGLISESVPRSAFELVCGSTPGLSQVVNADMDMRASA
jgi:hypothetical protein